MFTTLKEKIQGKTGENIWSITNELLKKYQQKYDLRFGVTGPLKDPKGTAVFPGFCGETGKDKVHETVQV